MSNGFSLVELLIVLAVIAILSAVSALYLAGNRGLFRADEQSLAIVDALQEARQRSLTQRETIRVEIDLTDGSLRLIDENRPETADDDALIRSVTLLPPAAVRIDRRPTDIQTDPAEAMPAPAAQYRPSIYPPSVTHNVCTLRFLRNGTVVNEGNDAVGTNAAMTGATLFVWSPVSSNDAESQVARAITVIGATGSVRLWEYDRALTSANKWKDSRRSGSYSSGPTGN